MLDPQHRTAPLASNAHECSTPVATCVTTPPTATAASSTGSSSSPTSLPCPRAEREHRVVAPATDLAVEQYGAGVVVAGVDLGDLAAERDEGSGVGELVVTDDVLVGVAQAPGQAGAPAADATVVETRAQVQLGDRHFLGGGSERHCAE